MASKSQRWVVDSGILRKKGVEEEPQELLVFGYSCKLFRDDEKAKMIDQGKHLIPWMGDNELRIDRYDGRGALGDLKMYEPPPGGFDLRTFLTEDELKVEQFCDEERYQSLYNNDAEESMYHEEEMKRFHQALDSENVYGQVAYNYNDEDSKKSEDAQNQNDASNSQEEEEAFVPPAELEIPEEMKVPDTEKLNAIITKTALFISRQGGQMEILIKAKQANNPQFSFLSIDGELYPYYRHVLEAIKSGKYNPEKEPVKEESEHDDDSDEDDQPYLHPSLAPSFAKVEAAPSIPSIPNIKYKPSADCAYSMLVNKITGKPPPSKMPQPEVPVQQQPPIQNYYQQAPVQPTYAAYSLPQQYSHGPVLYNTNGHLQATEASQPLENTVLTILAETPYHSQTKEPPPALVPYGSSKPLTRPSFIVPPADVQIIIDKMASYVAKNGRDFETIVKNKGDPRFNFLELSHQYHGYYAHKLTIYEGAINPRVITEEELLQKQELQEEKQKKLEEMQRKQQRMEEVQKRVKMIQAKKKGDVKTKPSITTVSFSIKKPKEGESNVIEKRNALPLEESDDDEDEERRENVHPKPDSPQESKKETVEDNAKDHEVETKYRPDDLELVDLTDDIFENIQKERRERQVENKLRDGSTSSKDKRTSSRERQLQLERKRKAAMFLSQIQSLSPLATKSINLTSNSKRDDDEISSVPSPTMHADVMEIEESSSQGNSLMNRLKSADLESKRPRYRSRSRSGSHGHSDRFKSLKKHKKKKSSHRSNYYDSPSSSRSHKSKKSKKSSRHRSRSPSRRHYASSRHSQRNSSSSDSSSDSP